MGETRGETYLVDELALLEDMLLKYEKQADANGEGWQEAEKKVGILIRIAKLVRAELINMELRGKAGHYDIATVAQRLLNESATAYVNGNADSAEVTVYDEVHRNLIAKFQVRLSSKCLLFDDHQFF